MNCSIGRFERARFVRNWQRAFERRIGVGLTCLGLAWVVEAHAVGPRLSVRFDGAAVFVGYANPSTGGVLTLFEATEFSGAGPAWQPAQSLPGTNSQGEFRVDLVDAPQRLFRVEQAAITVPDPMVWIAAGTFMMGSGMYEENAHDYEFPRHEVRIAQGFWMSKYEVTQADYATIMNANPSAYQGDPQAPVESLSWISATNYCAKLTSREAASGRLPPGCIYRLPTEAEWEYACRAGTTTVYSYGDGPDSLTWYAWWGYGDSEGHPHAVGTKWPNRWGLYDMHGNVFEYCLDWFKPYDPEAPPGTGIPTKISRGGSFYCPAWVLRSADRSHRVQPEGRSILHGFRVVLGSRRALEEVDP